MKFLIFHSALSALSCGKYLQGCCKVSYISFVVLPGLAEMVSPYTVGAAVVGCPSTPLSHRNVLFAVLNSHALRGDPLIWGKSWWKCCQGHNQNAEGLRVCDLFICPSQPGPPFYT